MTSRSTRSAESFDVVPSASAPEHGPNEPDESDEVGQATSRRARTTIRVPADEVPRGSQEPWSSSQSSGALQLDGSLQDTQVDRDIRDLQADAASRAPSLADYGLSLDEEDPEEIEDPSALSSLDDHETDSLLQDVASSDAGNERDGADPTDSSDLVDAHYTIQIEIGDDEELHTKPNQHAFAERETAFDARQAQGSDDSIDPIDPIDLGERHRVRQHDREPTMELATPSSSLQVGSNELDLAVQPPAKELPAELRTEPLADALIDSPAERPIELPIGPTARDRAGDRSGTQLETEAHSAHVSVPTRQRSGAATAVEVPSARPHAGTAFADNDRTTQLTSAPAPAARHWWEDFFDDDYLQTVRIPTDEQIQRQCDFLERALGLDPGASILDVGCGLGLHSVELSSRGYNLVGMDLSLPMLTRAADEAQQRNQKIHLIHGDMSAMSFRGVFDAMICIGTTFGYFDEETNRQLIRKFHDALKPLGLLLIEVVNRDYVIRDQPTLTWFEGDGCLCMEETNFQYLTSRLHVKRTVMLEDGRQKEADYSMRLYSFHELGVLLHQSGFRVVEVSGREATPGVFLGQDSAKLIILAERRS